jgi:hypothetical protein
LQVLLAGRRTWERSAVRHARILEVTEDEMVLSLPQPPLPLPLLGQELEISVLLDEAGGPRGRYAFPCSILDVLPPDAATEGAQPAMVVVFPRERDTYPTSLRQARRFTVTPESSLQLWLGDQRLKLLDISQKGLRFSDGELLAGCRPGDDLRLRLVVHDEPQKLHGRVAAVNHGERGWEVSLELGILPLDAWTSLMGALQELEHAANTQGAEA